MGKGLASRPASPRARWSIPVYPTLAAAGLSFCLSGCAPAGTIAAPFDRDASAGQLDLARETGLEAPGYSIQLDAPAGRPDSLAADGTPEAARAALDSDRADAGVPIDGSFRDDGWDGTGER